MAEFDPQKFEDKYEHYFTELQRAYQQAFDVMNDAHNSELIHRIDQGVLAESEPFYEGDGQFRIELPDDAVERLTGSVDAETADDVLDQYLTELEAQLQSVFGFESE
jgi:hypothetical protein